MYWANKGAKRSNEGSIARVAKSGGAVEIVERGIASPYGIAVTDNAVVWTEAVREGKGLGVRVGNVATGTLELPAYVKPPGNHEPWTVVVTGGTACFNDLLARDIECAPLGPNGIDGAVTTIATLTGRPVGLALDGANAYFTDSDRGAVLRAPLAGGAVVDLYKGGDKTTGLAIDNDHVYWTEWGSGRVAKVPKNGGAFVTLATDQKGARSIAVDDTRVYFTHPASGSIRSVPKNGGAVFTHATGQKHPYSLTIDATTIYWANVDGDTVMAIEK